MNTLYKDLIYLLSCAVNGITPDTAKVQAMDLERLYRLAKFHTVRSGCGLHCPETCRSS